MSERRQSKRVRTALTAIVRSRHRRKATVLRVTNLGAGGAQCRSTVGLRVGSTFPVEFVLDGRGVGSRPHVFRAWCRVAWTAARIGPARPIQEAGLVFVELAPDERRLLSFLLSDTAAA